MADSLHPNFRKRSSTGAIRDASASRKRKAETTQPTTIADAVTISEAITKDVYNAAINANNKVAETSLTSITESAQGTVTNTPNAALDIVMIEVDTPVTAVNKEALLMNLRERKEHYVPSSTKMHFYARCCSCGRETKTNREGTKCRNCRHERCPQCIG